MIHAYEQINSSTLRFCPHQDEALRMGDVLLDVSQIDDILHNIDDDAENHRRRKRKIRSDIDERKWNDTIYYKLASSLGKKSTICL